MSTQSDDTLILDKSMLGPLQRLSITVCCYDWTWDSGEGEEGQELLDEEAERLSDAINNLSYLMTGREHMISDPALWDIFDALGRERTDDCPFEERMYRIAKAEYFNRSLSDRSDEWVEQARDKAQAEDRIPVANTTMERSQLIVDLTSIDMGLDIYYV